MVDLGRRLGLAVQVADVTGAAWQYKKVKRKTERDDALTLPRLPAIEQINGVPACTRAMHQWRALIVYCARRSAEGTRIKNRIRAWLLREAWQLLVGQCAWSQTLRKTLAKHAQPLSERGPSRLWRAVPGLELEHLERVETLLASVGSGGYVAALHALHLVARSRKALSREETDPVPS